MPEQQSQKALPAGHPQLPPGRNGDCPEAFGKGARPPDYEAFGRADIQTRQPNPTEHPAEPGRNEEEPNHNRHTPPDRRSPTQPKQPAKRSNTDEENEDDQDEENSEDKKADQKKDEDGTKDDEKKAPPKNPPLYKRPAFLISAAVILIVLAVGGTLFWLWYRQYESTDDAYIDGHVTQISPQVAAPILQLHITDNQLVHQGDLLIELDPTDYQVALDQAQAQVLAADGRHAQASAQIAAAQAVVAQSAAEIDAAQVALDNTTRDLRRYQNVDERARSQQQLDNATAAQKNALAQLAQSKARLASAQANVTTEQAAAKASEGDLKQAQAAVERARVNLGYCRIVAPSDGRVTERTVENGTYVTAGQAMFALVSPEVWVTANFKESQLTRMQPGQPVTITVDAFPDKKFTGRVDSIQAGSGARFSVLPAENATGNFVKIVQRVPVKILFDHGVNTDDYRLLSPGLSVEPWVKVR